jgi:hypothetical protein
MGAGNGGANEPTNSTHVKGYGEALSQATSEHGGVTWLTTHGLQSHPYVSRNSLALYDLRVDPSDALLSDLLVRFHSLLEKAATTIQEQATSPSAALTQQVGANTVQRVREYDLSNLKLELAGRDGSLVTITAQQGQHKMHIRWPSNNATEQVSLQKPTSRVRLAFHTVSNTGSLTPASAPEGLKSRSLLITPATTDQLLLLLMGAALQKGKLMIQIGEATSKLPLYIPPDRKGHPPAGQTQPGTWAQHVCEYQWFLCHRVPAALPHSTQPASGHVKQGDCCRGQQPGPLPSKLLRDLQMSLQLPSRQL